MHEASDSASAEVIAQRRFYRGVLELMNESRIPYVVGGGYALEQYTGSARDSKDLDLVVEPVCARAVLQAIRQ